jgi:hypothetical protein
MHLWLRQGVRYCCWLPSLAFPRRPVGAATVPMMGKRPLSWTQQDFLRPGCPASDAFGGGSKLMFSSSRWHRSRLVRASIAIGLAVIGVLSVWAALARPSTPDSGLAGAPNGRGMPSTSPSALKRTPERCQQRERIRSTVGTRLRGWSCRSLTRWLCLYLGLASDRCWSTLG